MTNTSNGPKDDSPVIEQSKKHYQSEKRYILAYILVATTVSFLGEIFFISILLWYGFNDIKASLPIIVFSLAILAFFTTAISQMIFFRYCKRSRISANGLYRAYPDVNTKNLFRLAFNIPDYPINYYHPITEIERVEFYWLIKWPKYFLVCLKDGTYERFDLDKIKISPPVQSVASCIENFFKSFNIPVRTIIEKKLTFNA